MVNIKGYISTHFSRAFFIIFLPFFLIISLVYLVKISALTTQIQMTMPELLQLYSYSVPNIIFYTLPLSFMVALSNVLLKLSQDNELIALYALGLQSKKVLRPLLILGVLFSLLLTAISFLSMPLSKQLYKEFIHSKKSEAKLNIVPGKLGQKFGDYYIYVKAKDGSDKFENIVIYNRTKREEEQFFTSNKGEIHKNAQVTSLELQNGYGYTYTEKNLQQAKYESLEVFDKVDKKAFEFEDIIAHWGKATTDIKRMHRALFFLFVSLIPLLSVYLIAAYTMINPRYQASRSFLIVFISGMGLYIIASSLEKWGTFVFLIFAIISVALLGQWLFRYRVARYF